MEMLKSSSFESASGCMLPASEWWWWCGRHIHIKSWTSGKRCPPTLTVCESSEHQCYIHTVHLSSSSCRSPHHWLSSSTHSLMELHLDTCRVSWLCHWVLYFGSWQRPERLLSALPLLPWTLWSIKDQMVSTEQPSSHDAFIALAIKIDNRLREQEKWRRAVVPPNQRGHSTMQPSPASSPSASLGWAMLFQMSGNLCEGWCIYCGELGLFTASCPLFLFLTHWLILKLSLPLNLTEVLVDSGADERCCYTVCNLQMNPSVMIWRLKWTLALLA